MSQKEIFPTEIVEFTTENLISENTVKSQIIYSAIVLSIIAVIVLLPFIYVDITVQGDGLIRPVTEKTEIIPLSTGIVTNIYIKESQTVEAGDTLLLIKKDNIESEIKFSEYQITQNEGFINDLQILTNSGNSLLLQSSVYKQTYLEYKQKISEYETIILKAKQELERNKILFEKGTIPGKEYDDLKYSLETAENELNTYKESILNVWESDLIEKQNLKEQLQTQLTQYNQNLSNSIITHLFSY